MASSADDFQNVMRMDIVQLITDVDEDEGTYNARIEPDPRRYEWVARDGERLLWDRFDKVLIPHGLVMKMLREAIEMPRPAPLPVLGDLDRWLRERRPAIGSVLDGHPYPDPPANRSEEVLAALPDRGDAFVILSLDLASFSQWLNAAPRETGSRLLQVLAYEAALLVALFHGHVLRYEGDGLIAYFPQPSFIAKNDLAVDCGFCLNRLVEEAINPELVARGIPTVHARTGVEAGQASVVLIGAAASKRHVDLVGDVVAIAVNARKRARPGQVVLGEICERNSHVAWRDQCDRVEPSAPWPYQFEDRPYRLFALVPPAVRPIEQPPITARDPADGREAPNL